MKGLELACRINFMCDNYGLLFGRKRLLEGLARLHEIRTLVNQALRSLVSHRSIVVERVVSADDNLGGVDIRYLNLRSTLGGTDAILSKMESRLTDIGVNRPCAKFVGFYHPALTFIDGEERRRVFMPNGRIFDTPEATVVELNLANQKMECWCLFVKGVLYVGLAERAFGMPNREMINGYYDSLFSSVEEGEMAEAYRQFGGLFQRTKLSFSRLSERLEGKVSEELMESQRFAAELVIGE